MRKFNDLIADKLSSLMATMTLFWLLLILDVVGAIIDPPSSAQGWLLWGVSILFQSVALPVLAFVSNKQSERTEKVLRETHDVVLEELAMVKEELALAREEREDMKKLLKEVHKQTKGGNYIGL